METAKKYGKSAGHRMKHLRLLAASILLGFLITGCHRTVAPVVPPPQAQAPIISTMPPLPSLVLSPVQQGKPEPPAPVTPPPQPVQPPKKRTRTHYYHRRKSTKPAGATSPNSSKPTPAGTSPADRVDSPFGRLSADDTATNPKQIEQTQHLIEALKRRLKRIPLAQTAHKDTVTLVHTFLMQAQQALNSNDLVGAKTLANKARILLDELIGK